MIDSQNTLLVYVPDKDRTKANDFLISCISNRTLAGLCHHFNINNLNLLKGNGFKSTSLFNTKVGKGSPFGLVVPVDNSTKIGILTSQTALGVNTDESNLDDHYFIAGRDPKTLKPYNFRTSITFSHILQTIPVSELRDMFKNMSFFDGFHNSKFIFFFGRNNTNNDGIAASYCNAAKTFVSLKFWRLKCTDEDGVDYKKLNAIQLKDDIVYAIFAGERGSVFCSTAISNLIFKKVDSGCVPLSDGVCKLDSWTSECPNELTKNRGDFFTEKVTKFEQRASLPGIVGVSFILEQTASFTTAFFGLEDGSIAKVEILDSKISKPYSVRKISNSGKILGKLFISQNHLIIPAEKGIFKAKLSNCGDYKTCVECNAAKDPHCGWCLTTSSCVEQSLCPNTAWTPFKQNQCPEAKIRPSKVSWDSLKDVELELNLKLPNSKSDVYECVYDDNKRVEAHLKDDSKTIVCNNFPPVEQFSSTS